MRLPIIHVAAVFILLVLVASVAAQQVDESKIVTLRATIQKLEGLSGDTNIPAETRQNLNELLFEKRGELHALLRQKRDGLRAKLQSTTSPAEQASLNETIRRLNQEMQQLSGVSTAPSATAEAGSSQPPGSGNGVVTHPAGNGVSTETPPAATMVAAPTPTTTTPASSVPAVAAPAASQPGAQDPCADLLNAPALPELDFTREVDAATCRMLFARTGRGTPTDAQVDFRNYSVVIALALARLNVPRVAVPELTAQAENASHAKNVSAGSSSAGSTALVSKAGLPAVFGFAVENGALTRKVDGTTVTFTGNPVGIIETLAKKGFIDSFQNQDDFTAFLRKLSFGVSFDTSRGDQSGVFTADRQQLSGFSFKYNIMDQRDPRSSRWTRRWQALTNKQASSLARSLNSFVIALATPPGFPGFDAWLTNARQTMAGKNNFDDIKRGWQAELDKLAALPLTPEMEALVKQVGTDFEALIEERNDILDEISNGWVATFDYNNERPAGSPSLSNFRFLAEKGAYNGSIDFTSNASLTIYNSRPTTPNTQRLRDFRFAGQIDVPIGNVSKTGKFMLSFAGRYERLLNDEPVPGTTAVIKKGDIAAGQFKLTIPIRGTALKIPLSVTFANRTELIQEKEVRGNFGVTFDLDSILAKFNPFSKP